MKNINIEIISGLPKGFFGNLASFNCIRPYLFILRSLIKIENFGKLDVKKNSKVVK